MGKNRHRNSWGNSNTVVSQPNPPVTPPGTVAIRVGIDPPPDYIFKFRKNRAAPAKDLAIGNVTYAPVKAEYIDGVGNFVYYYGCKYPSRSIMPHDAILAVNGIKRLFISILTFIASKELILPLGTLLLIGKKRRGRLLNKACVKFNGMADATPGLAGWYLEDGYYHRAVKEIRTFLQVLLIDLGVEADVAIKTSEVIGMMFEYDEAYMRRFLDVMTEANKEHLLWDLPWEAKRLLKLVLERDGNPENLHMIDFKFQAAVRALSVMWYIPSMRKALKKAINAANFENCKLDEMDIYHSVLYGSYNTQGKSLEERKAWYAEIHGTDETKWPPRAVIG